MIKVYGFPRSGAHYLTHLIGANFYPGDNLESPAGQVGHWANRAQVGPVEYGQLAGHHGPPSWGVEHPAVYLYRDARAVAASLFRSPHFKNPSLDGVSFSDFIREPLDWKWTVGNRADNPSNVIDHWREHLSIWRRQDVPAIRYEDLARYPATQLARMAYVFGLDRPDEWAIPDKLVGHFPSGGKRLGWSELWSSEDERWFYERVPKEFYGLMELA